MTDPNRISGGFDSAGDVHISNADERANEIVWKILQQDSRLIHLLPEVPLEDDFIKRLRNGTDNSASGQLKETVGTSAVLFNPVNVARRIVQAIIEICPELGFHLDRVADRALDIGRGMDISSDILDVVYQGALLHDVGKLDSIVADIIKKPCRLPPDEKLMIRIHPVLGGSVAEKFGRHPSVVEIVSDHHKRPDHHGYPRLEDGEEIPVHVRIVTVADAVESILGNRPGRRAGDKARVIAELDKGTGTHFDPDVVASLKGIL
ncbi:HD domain-containing protein [Candidatus Peregrinibacteria bacterium]|nr:HD domain-containing protein [Candidatus Peregrinibacteria bacterium]